MFLFAANIKTCTLNYKQVHYCWNVVRKFHDSAFFEVGLPPPPIIQETKSFSVLNHGSSKPMYITIAAAREKTNVAHV